MISDEKIASLLNRFAYLEAKMNDGVSGDEMVRAAREYAELRPVAEQAQSYRDMQIALIEARELLEDPDMADLAQGKRTLRMPAYGYGWFKRAGQCYQH